MTGKSNTLNAYFPSIDGLRAISILLVVLSHLLIYSKLFTSSPVPGGLGVTIFFFISGFLITNLLLAEYEKNKSINLRLFYIRRVLRLYPPLLLMMICITAFLWFTQNIISFQEINASLFYYENYFLAYHPVYVDKYGILWSLAVEEHFYLLFPFILLLCLKKSRILLSVTIGLILIPLVLRILIADHYNANETSQSYTYSLTHCRFDSILYGCLTSILLTSKYSDRFLKLISAKPVYISALLLFGYTFINRNEFFRETIRYSLQGICFMFLIPPAIYCKNYILFKKALSSKGMVFIGKLSYSIYLFHYVAIKLLAYFTINNPAIYIVVNIILSGVLSLASYFYLEVPIMRLRKKFGSSVKTPVQDIPLSKEALA